VYVEVSDKVEMRNLSCHYIYVTDTMLNIEQDIVFDSLRAHNHVYIKIDVISIIYETGAAIRTAVVVARYNGRR
jgi:hypothetical protein